MIAASAEWFMSGATDDRPYRLYCLPYAGGSAAAFARWRALVDQRISLVPVQLPGRGSRIRERPVDRLATLADDLAAALAPTLDRPYALFGHSMGAALAFETARALRRDGRPTPSVLFVSARRAPQCPPTRPPLHALPDARLLSELNALGGMPQAVREDKELLDLMLPIVRADLKAVETHTFAPGAPLSCPIVAFGGTHDTITRDEISAWGELTTGSFTLTMLEGDHFFINAHADTMLARMSEDLTLT